MKEWNYIKLSDYCEIFPGYACDSSKFTSVNEDIHLVKGENLHQGYIDWTNAKKWTVTDWNSLKKFQLKENDIVVAMDRPWIEAGLKWSSIKKVPPMPSICFVSPEYHYYNGNRQFLLSV